MQIENKNYINKGLIYAFLVLLLCLFVFLFKGSFGYTKHQLSQDNNMQSPGVAAEITETFPDHSVTAGSTKQKKVHFSNNGQTPLFIRMSYAEYWESASETIVSAAAVTKNWTAAFNSEWELKADGWYYYKKVLPAGGNTADILNSVTFPAAVPAGADYNLVFMLEAVQASDEASVNDAATQTLFGRKGTVTNMQMENGAVISGNVVWD